MIHSIHSTELVATSALGPQRTSRFASPFWGKADIEWTRPLRP